MSTALERRYRRVLRLLPGWYREQWEQDMVAAFLDSWLTGDQEADEYIRKAAGPSASEVASVAWLAVRLRLVGPGTARRYTWGQAIRRAVVALLLLHAVLAVDVLVFLGGAALWSAGCRRRRTAWGSRPPAPGPWCIAWRTPRGLWLSSRWHSGITALAGSWRRSP